MAWEKERYPALEVLFEEQAAHFDVYFSACSAVAEGLLSFTMDKRGELRGSSSSWMALDACRNAWREYGKLIGYLDFTEEEAGILTKHFIHWKRAQIKRRRQR